MVSYSLALVGDVHRGSRAAIRGKDERVTEEISEFWFGVGVCKEEKGIPSDDPQLRRSNLFANRDAAKKPRSGATENPRSQI